MFFNKGDRTEDSRSRLQLENDCKTLSLQYMTATDQLNTFKKTAFKYQDEYNKLSKKINSFCLALLESDYAKSQIGGNNPMQDMDVYSLISYAEQEYKSNRAIERELLTTLTRQLQQKNQEIEGLKAQISRYLLKEQQSTDFSMLEQDEKEAVEKINTPAKEPVSVDNQPAKTSPVDKPVGGVTRIAVFEDDEDIEILPSKPMNNSKEPSQSDAKPLNQNQHKADGHPASISEKIDGEIKEVASVDVSDKALPQSNPHFPSSDPVKVSTEPEKGNYRKKEHDVVAHVVNLNDYVSKMNEYMWNIVIAIGKEGLSESKDIKKYVVKDEVTDSAFNTALTQLRKMNIIEQEKINTGWRWFYSFELSDIGNRIYLEKFGKNPVVCEKQILKREHTSALHGYCIKDTAYIVKTAFGYDETITERRINSTKMYNGETYIPDVVAKKKQGSIVDYFEVELGHHTQADFNSKCDKMKMVTKDLYFVVPDADTMNRILARQIGQWVLEKGGKDKLKGITVYLTTLTKLNEGKWENTYPFN